VANCSTAVLSTLVTGGTPGFSYAWSDGSTTPSITVSTSGTYCVTVTDANGCTAVDCQNVFVASPLAVVLLQSGGCSTATIGASVSGGNPAYSFNWSNGSVAPNITVATSGTYCVTVTDARGCTANAFIEIEERNPLSFLLTADTACAQSTTSATFSWSGAVEPIVQLGEELDWQTLTPGYYELSWMDGAGCLVQTDFFIHEYPSLEWEAEIGGAADDALITLEIAGGQPPYSIQWSNGETGESLLSWDQEVNSATITDAAGCAIATDEFFVPLGIDVAHIRRHVEYLPGVGLVNQSEQNEHFYVIDSRGRLLVDDELRPGERWPCAHLPMGNYCVVQSGRVMRFVVMR
jgi:hypothetical protein